MCLQNCQRVDYLLLSELLSAGRRLMALGEDVSSIETALQIAGVTLAEGPRPQQQTDVRSQDHKTDLKPEGQSSLLDGGSRLARGSAADLASLNQGMGTFKGHTEIPELDTVQQDGPSSKRKRVDSKSDTELQTKYASRGRTFEICRSRDQMPPPPIPIQQPFAQKARVPHLDMQSLKSQYDQVNTTQLPVTPQRHPFVGGLRQSMLAPDSPMERSNRLLAGTRTNDEQSHIDHHQPPRVNRGIARPAYIRGGWQPSPGSFDTERSDYFSSPNLPLYSIAQSPVRSTKYHQGSMMFPLELEDCTIDPSSRSYHSVSSDGLSSYHRRQPVPAMQSQLESPTHSGYHDLSLHREGRITLSRTPSFTSRYPTNKSIGLSSHVRSSSRQTNPHLANSSSDRQQLVVTTPAYQRFSASARSSPRPRAYRSSLPTLGGSKNPNFRRDNSFDSGPTLTNGEMRPYSSGNSEYMFLPYRSRVSQTRDRGLLIETQASGPHRRAYR